MLPEWNYLHNKNSLFCTFLRVGFVDILAIVILIILISLFIIIIIIIIIIC